MAALPTQCLGAAGSHVGPRGPSGVPSHRLALGLLFGVLSATLCTAAGPVAGQADLQDSPVAAAFAAVEEALNGSLHGVPGTLAAEASSSSRNSSGNSSSSSSEGEAPHDRFASIAPPLSFREPLSLMPKESSSLFYKLAACADMDPRCQYELSLFYLLGRPPLASRCLVSALKLLWLAAHGGSAEAQYLLGVLHQNFYLLPHEPPLLEPDRPLRVVVNANLSLSFYSGDREASAPWGPLRTLDALWHNLCLRADAEGLGFWVWEKLKRAFSWIGDTPQAWGPQEGAPGTVAEAMDVLLTAPNFAPNPSLPLVYMHAASVAQHPAAAAAVAWRQQFAAFDGSVGQQQQACAAAANHYLPIAKATAGVYASGIPQAVEVLRLTRNLGFAEEEEFYRLSTDPEHLTMLVHEANEGNVAVHALLGRKFLFGVDGFPQDFAKARYHLLAASRSTKGEAKSLLGYIYALGLGVEADLDEAAEWFFRGAKENQDPIAYNGLGLVYFFGTPLIESSPALAFEMFNKSATLNSPDGQLNLASLYLTGTGTQKSFVEALKWFTKAVRGGSTGAAYALGVMHLSGLGAVRDCPLAAGLLKLATERTTYFAHTLQRAHTAYEQNAYDEAAFNFLLLAEAGHEASQSNLAFMLDAGLTDIFFDGTLRRKRLHAQRFYEMAAAQGSLSAQLRLGDFAYYGYGARRRSTQVKAPKDFVDEKGDSFEGWLFQQKPSLEEGVKDFAEAAAFYRKVADSAAWDPALAAKARYNLGAMHLFGIGASKDLFLASNHFNRSLDADEHAPTAPVYAGLAAVYFLDFFERVGPVELFEALLEEPRVLLLLLNLLAICLLLVIRAIVQSWRRGRVPTDNAFSATIERGPGPAAEARLRQQQQQQQQQQHGDTQQDLQQQKQQQTRAEPHQHKDQQEDQQQQQQGQQGQQGQQYEQKQQQQQQREIESREGEESLRFLRVSEKIKHLQSQSAAVPSSSNGNGSSGSNSSSSSSSNSSGNKNCVSSSNSNDSSNSNSNDSSNSNSNNSSNSNSNGSSDSNRKGSTSNRNGSSSSSVVKPGTLPQESDCFPKEGSSSSSASGNPWSSSSSSSNGRTETGSGLWQEPVQTPSEVQDPGVSSGGGSKDFCMQPNNASQSYS